MLSAACQQSAGNDSTDTGESILVIGAGMAGLGAARQLQDAGHTVMVIEGRDRIGGRVWTSRVWEDAPVDMGASWIHGVSGNPIAALAEEAGIETVKTDFDSWNFYDTDGQAVPEVSIETIESTASQLIASADAFSERGKTFKESIEATALWDGLSTRERQQVRSWLNTTLEHEYAGGLDELSAFRFDDADAFGGDDVVFPDGYGRLVEYLARDLDIRLGQVVEAISYGDDVVIVQTDKVEYIANRVIVTLPIGVLQSGEIRFDPALPEEKQVAIDVMGAGLLDKLYLRFPDVFWDEAEWVDWISAEPGRWNEWLNISAYIGSPVLLGFNAAGYARKIDAWSDEEIVADAMDVLRTIYGADIPDPESWQMTRWALDPFARCAYSFNAVGASVRTREALAEPVGKKLFFAGEATSADFPSTVHGAYMSGLDAAATIMQDADV